MKLVKLTYDDITQYDNKILNKAKDSDPLQFTIIGELVYEDSKKVIVATEICEDRNDEQSAYYVIPKGCVVKKVMLK
jgi:hypothetical protein